jgi:hypothetical protein
MPMRMVNPIGHRARWEPTTKLLPIAGMGGRGRGGWTAARSANFSAAGITTVEAWTKPSLAGILFCDVCACAHRDLICSVQCVHCGKQAQCKPVGSGEVLSILKCCSRQHVRSGVYV